eukprot:8135822-Lingulodinium_polyedra.AAC.1
MDKLPWQLPGRAIEALATLVEDVVAATTGADGVSVQAGTEDGGATRMTHGAQPAQEPARRSPAGGP